MKPKRIVDEELLDVIRSISCICCLATPSQPHHVKSRGAGGDDVAINLLPLCALCHYEIHKRGLVYMSEEYPGIREWLVLAGWEQDQYGRWKHDNTKST